MIFGISLLFLFDRIEYKEAFTIFASLCGTISEYVKWIFYYASNTAASMSINFLFAMHIIMFGKHIAL